MLNPNKKIVESKGIDIPIMYVYLAGRISGNCIDKCLAWRNQIVEHFKNYKNKGVYPISFLDALNSKESDSIDAQGLTSAIPPNLIYDKDLMSVEKADVVIANMEDYFEEGIYDLLTPSSCCIGLGIERNGTHSVINLQKKYQKLQEKILNRRPNYGTIMEVAWCLYLKKPLILIAGTTKRKEILEKHPFTKRASVIVETVDELLEKKWLNILYKSISGATYE